MPAFNFQKQFANDVETGKKTQTIRAKRKARPRVGQIAYCFTGMRTRGCRRLCSGEISLVVDVTLMDEGVLLNGGALLAPELDVFAERDGFENWAQMRAWFEKQHGLPFRGDMVIWQFILPNDDFDACCGGRPMVTQLQAFSNRPTLGAMAKCGICGDLYTGPTVWQCLIAWNKKQRWKV